MGDLMKEANYLKFYHQSEAALKDKDYLKNETHMTHSKKVSSLFAVPLFFQMWQLSLTGHEAQVARYKQIRMFKFVTFLGAAALGSYELIQLRKKWAYYDHFYPEPTELQKTLFREAMLFKEADHKVSSVQERMAVLEDPKARQIYSQMYSLPPQRYAEPDDDPNAAEHKQH